MNIPATIMYSVEKEAAVDLLSSFFVLFDLDISCISVSTDKPSIVRKWNLYRTNLEHSHDSLCKHIAHVVA